MQIAELLGSRHSDVKRSLERLAEKSVISLPPMAQVKIQRERRAEAVEVYVFAGEQGERDSIILVAQLSPEFTARLVDSWREMKEQLATPALPKNYIEALEAHLASEKRAEQLAIANAAKDAQIERDKPKVQFAEDFQHSDVVVTLSQMANLCGVGRKTFISWLRRDKIFQKQRCAPYQQYIDRDFFDVKEDIYHDDAGRAHPTLTARVTIAGQAWLKNLYRAEIETHLAAKRPKRRAVAVEDDAE
ncbi:DNA-binding protein [Paraburkholderia sp. Ac-20340]|uniref:phage antirepressor KilAC domain-containing protein n=1 Tax=Paraburkholderia sp. Ac-20340 TaxID=2703888 RepID=UPI00197DC8A0|nr:phage antirepressor KilAC domain-containing protein [Paraburkholderia sp. Ac-20340]MBN3852831.1 DNA-binding protein [Paraburkholderia sp. Ac-20340]